MKYGTFVPSFEVANCCSVTSLGVEEGRHRLQLLGRLADVDHQQRGRGQVVGGGHPQQVVAVRIDRADAGGAHGGHAVEEALLPAAFAQRGQHADLALHVAEQGDDEVLLRPGEGRQRGVFVRREHHIEFAVAGHELVEVDDQQRAGGVFAVLQLPWLAQFQGQPLVVHGLVGGVRHVELDQLAVLAAQVQLVVVERERAADEAALVARGQVVVGRDVHVGRLAFVHDLGRGHRRAALPFLDHARIAGRGERAIAEIGVDIDRVAVDPLQAALGLGTEEAVLHPGHGGQVELAGHVGVGAAARQRDQAALVLRLEAFGAVPDPLLVLGAAFGGVQRVEVDHRFPLRRGLAVFLQRGAAPQAARVRLVAPEVVVVVADLGHARDAVGRIQDRAQVGFELLEFGRAGDLRFGLGVAFAHPFQRLGILHAFEPEVGVGGHGGIGHGGGGFGGGRRGEGDQGRSAAEGKADGEADMRELGHAGYR